MQMQDQFIVVDRVIVVLCAGSSLVMKAIRSMMDPVSGGCDEVRRMSVFFIAVHCLLNSL